MTQDELNLQSNLPPDLLAAQQQLNRQQQMAQLLMKQGQQTPQGQEISGRYVAPSWTQHLANLAQTGVGAYLQNKGDKQALEIAKQLREGKLNTQQAITEAVNENDIKKALALATADQYGAGKEFIPQLIKASIPETPASVREYEYAQKYPQYAQYVAGMKRAGAPSVSVSMEKGIANQIGPMLKEAKPQAVSAVKGIDAANQVIGAIDSNKMYAGPLANTRLSIAQIGTSLGVGGKDMQDKINNTRSAIQGLAEITLQGRQEMHGQGAITESEGKLAERAKSGDISFTPGELKLLANAAKRAGEYTYGNYQAQIQSLAKNPETAQLVPFFQVNQMPARKMPSVVEQPNVNEQLNIPSTGAWRVKQ
jgi:hypothetical protein